MSFAVASVRVSAFTLIAAMDPSSAIAVVTGAARGIGWAISAALHSAGARVVLGDRDEEALAVAVEGLAGGRAHAVVSDVSSPADVARLADEAARVFGPADVWINNAGLARHRPITDYTPEDIDLMLAVNLKGTILGSQAALRAMQPQRRGHVINIVSTAALRGVPTETVYCATKWGVRGFTQGLREEAAPFRIRVTALLPGGVDTAFWDSAVSGRRMPVESFLRPAQVADAVLALMRMEDDVVPQELVLRAMDDRDFAL